MNKFYSVAIFAIGAIFSVFGLIVGVVINASIKEIIGYMTLASILGISVGPQIAYVFADAKLKIYLTAGPVGLAFIKLSIKLFALDSKVTEAEIEKLRKYMSKEFGEEIGNAAEKYFKQNCESTESTFDICKPIMKMTYSQRIGVVSQLFSMAMSDGEYLAEVDVVMQKIAHYLQIGKKRYNIIKSNYQKKYIFKNSFNDEQNAYYQENSQGKGYQFLNQFFIPTYNPYLILGLENNVSNEEIKKVYRDLVKKYHPDVLMDKSEIIKKQAKDKFLEINEAYEKIKKIRGMK